MSEVTMPIILMMTTTVMVCLYEQFLLTLKIHLEVSDPIKLTGRDAVLWSRLLVEIPGQATNYRLFVPRSFKLQRHLHLQRCETLQLKDALLLLDETEVYGLYSFCVIGRWGLRPCLGRVVPFFLTCCCCF